MGRTTGKFLRVYANGYDLSGYTVGIGPLLCEYDTNPMACLTDPVKGSLLGRPTLGVGTLNGVMDTTALGLHAALSAPGAARKVMVAIGDAAAPAAGDPVYAGEFNQLAYSSEPGETMSTVTVPFGKGTPVTGMNYEKPFGVLLHAKGSETAVNEGSGIENAAATSGGGYLMYQIFSITGTGTVTISIDESSDDGDEDGYAALTGATSGAIATASAPVAGIVQLATDAAVEQYLRWQIAFGGSASACNFALAFIRG